MPTPDFQVTNNDGIIAISGRLDFTTATQALSAVNEHLSAISTANSQVNDNAVVIDLNGVTHSNSAGLALLIEWLAQAQRASLTVRFENIPNSLRQFVRFQPFVR